MTLKYAHLSPKHLRETVNLGSLGGLLHTVASTVAMEEGSAAGSVQPVDSLYARRDLNPQPPDP